jgi:hypothetical protein
MRNYTEIPENGHPSEDRPTESLEAQMLRILSHHKGIHRDSLYIRTGRDREACVAALKSLLNQGRVVEIIQCDRASLYRKGEQPKNCKVVHFHQPPMKVYSDPALAEQWKRDGRRQPDKNTVIHKAPATKPVSATRERTLKVAPKPQPENLRVETTPPSTSAAPPAPNRRTGNKIASDIADRVPLTGWVPLSTKEQVRRVAESQGVSVSSLLTEIITEWLTNQAGINEPTQLATVLRHVNAAQAVLDRLAKT